MRRALPYILVVLLSFTVQGATAFAADEQPVVTTPHMINDVRYWSGGEFTRVVMDLTGDAHFAVNRIESPARVYFDFAGCKLVKSQTISVDDKHVGTVRTGQYDSQTVRVVVDLKNDIGFKVFRLTAPSRVVVDIYKRDGEGSTPASSPAPKEQAPVITTQDAPKRMSPESLSKVMAEATAKNPARTSPARVHETSEKSTLPVLPAPDPVLQTVKAEPPAQLAPAAEPKPAASPEATTAQEASPSNIQSPAQSGKQTRIIKGKVPPPLKRIVIDPGHGGRDPGAVGLGGLKEKEVALDVARRLKRELESRGYEVILTRSRDAYVDLEERAVLANQRDADLFVSVHVNANRNPSVRGIETYVLKWSDEQSSQEVAERENMVSARRMKQGRDDVGVMLASLALAHKSEQSAHLATRVQNSMEDAAAKAFSPAPSNKAKGAMFYVLYGAKMPSILVELAYVTNRDDAARLKNTRFRELIAGGIADGIDAYFKEPMPHLRVAMR